MSNKKSNNLKQGVAKIAIISNKQKTTREIIVSNKQGAIRGRAIKKSNNVK
jgi:hypothetical protein